jgi:hypothetical protein
MDNCNSLTKLHILQISTITAHLKPSVCQSIVTSCCQVAAANNATQTESHIYVTTDGESARLSWWQAPIWCPRPDFYYCQDSYGFVDVGRPLWRRRGLSFIIAAGPRQHRHSRVRVPRDPWPYFIVSDRDSPNLENHVSVLISSRNRVTQLYSQALGSFFFTSFDSRVKPSRWFSLYSLGTDRIENTAANISSICVDSLPRKCIYHAVIYQWPPPLFPLFRFSVVMLQ